MIDILIPVLGRPHNAAPLVQNIRDTTEADHQIIFLCSKGDPEQIKACVATDATTRVVNFPAGHADYARKINLGYRTTGDAFFIGEDGRPGPIMPGSEWVFVCADDVRFEPRWDINALKVAGDQYHVVATNDLANAQVQRGLFGTHCLVRRRYITDTGADGEATPGVVLHEGYDHNFVDRELCHVAQHRGVFAFARHSRVRHYHPLWKTATNDATYRKSLHRFRDDQQLFLSRAHLWGCKGLSDQERKLAA
jgi:hypothetical protein